MRLLNCTKKVVSSDTGTQQIRNSQVTVSVLVTLVSLHKALRVISSLAMIGNELEQFKIYLEINARRIDENKGIKFTASTIYFALYLCKHRFLLVYYFDRSNRHL